MLELNIKGRDVQELYVNASNMLLLLMRGGAAMAQQPQKSPESPPVDPPAPVETAPESVAEPNPPVVTKPKPGRSKKAPPTIEAVAEPDPLGLDDVKPAASAEFTADDVKARMKALVEAHRDEKGNLAHADIAKLRGLLEPFGVKTAGELKPENFADFMANSEKLLKAA